MQMDFFRYRLYGLPAHVVRICRFFASDALNLLFRADSALLNLLFRADSALLNLLFRDFLGGEPCLQYVPDFDHGNGCTKKCHAISFENLRS